MLPNHALQRPVLRDAAERQFSLLKKRLNNL
jgi:hypothetical protein